MDAANTYSGPTTVSAGELQIATGNAVASSDLTVSAGATLSATAGTTIQAPSITLDGGSLSIGSLTVQAAGGVESLLVNAGTLVNTGLAVGAGGLANLPVETRVILGATSLAVDETATGGLVDLGSGELTVAAGGIAAADLRADIIAGRNGGAWNGTTGITSAAAASSGGTRSVGYIVAGDGSARVSFAAPGDANLDGNVNVFDLVDIDASGTYGSGGASVWSQGDFNYDGVTNVFDLVGIDTAGAYGTGNYFPAGPTALSGPGSIAAVPEPSAVHILVLAAAGILAAKGWARRRRAGYTGGGKACGLQVV
jgi:predicted secreted protein